MVLNILTLFTMNLMGKFDSVVIRTVEQIRFVNQSATVVSSCTCLLVSTLISLATCF